MAIATLVNLGSAGSANAASALTSAGGITITVTQIPVDSTLKAKGTNGSAQGGGTGATSTASVTPDSLSAGYCGTAYEAWDNYGAGTVNVESVAACTNPISQIVATAFVIANDKYVAENTLDWYDVAEVDTTATYHCGTQSQCESKTYSGTDAQTFVNPSGWVGAIGRCHASGSVMSCVGTLGKWSY